MSLRLRVRYQVKYLTEYLGSFQMPRFLTGGAARFTLAALTIFLLGGFVYQISFLTTGGYEIAKLEKSISAVSDENDKLKTEIASYQSISSVQKRLQSLGMVKGENVRYVRLTKETAVAQR
jgi:hypothetical protein